MESIDKIVSARPISVLMARSEASFELARQRRAWWLLAARLAAGMNQGGVAVALGLAETSASTVGDWERGVQDPSLRQLHDLAVLYDVPLTIFTEPAPTDEERLEDLMGHPSRRREQIERPRRQSRTG